MRCSIVYSTPDFNPFNHFIGSDYSCIYYFPYVFIVLVYPGYMGIDKREVPRGKCTECECKEFECKQHCL